jgi:hypothetical protein
MSLEKSIEDLNHSVGTLCDLINKLVEMGGPSAGELGVVVRYVPESTAPDNSGSVVTGEDGFRNHAVEPDDLKAQFVALVNAKGSAAMHAILKDFGAAKLSGIQPEQYGAVAEAIEQAMGAE